MPPSALSGHKVSVCLEIQTHFNITTGKRIRKETADGDKQMVKGIPRLTMGPSIALNHPGFHSIPSQILQEDAGPAGFSHPHKDHLTSELQLARGSRPQEQGT